MIDERTAELIQADIDGCLPEARRAELSRVLLADPEARAFHRDMQRLQEQLEAVAAEEVPQGFADSVMAAIPASAPGAGSHVSSRSLRRVLALAAGVAVVAVALRIGGLGGEIDGTAAVGTMAGLPASAPVTIDRPEVSGSVQLRQAGESLIVDLDVALHEDVQIVAVQANSSASLTGRAGAAQDRQRLTLELPAGASGPVSVRFASHGQLIGDVLLEAPVGRH
jgi:hypothetical protein